MIGEVSSVYVSHRDQTYLERECALGPFWQKMWQLQKARSFYKMA